MMNRIWNEESGVLTFEWILLITLLVIGIVGGLALIRDAYIIEAAETAEAMTALNQGYHVEAPLTVGMVSDKAAANQTAAVTVIHASGTDSTYNDIAAVVTVAQP